VGWPVTLKPPSLEKTTKAYHASSISMELYVRGWGGGRLKKKGTPVPFREENLPHIQILEELPVKPHVVKTTGDSPS